MASSSWLAKKCSSFPRSRFLLEIFRAGKIVARLAGDFELQSAGRPGAAGVAKRGAGLFVGDVRRAQEFFLQRRGEQNRSANSRSSMNDNLRTTDAVGLPADPDRDGKEVARNHFLRQALPTWQEPAYQLIPCG